MFPPQILYLLEILSPVLSPIWQILKSWWWLFIPFILWQPLSFLWLWRRKDIWLKKINFILLEIKIPKEVLKPMRAMETVIDGLWQIIYDVGGWWERWIDGKILLSYSFEIASIGGETHFFVRIPEVSRDPIESAIYSQYPDAEISIAEDYTKYVPQDIPNKDWDIWGTDYQLIKPDSYPLKTYPKFFEEMINLKEAKERIKASDIYAGSKFNLFSTF